MNKYKQGIKNAFKTNYSNGPLESLNNNIKIINRIAHGYRSFLNLYARIYLFQGLILLD
ncbi:transposase [Vagococcus elongatus]|uniref:transposase n=1 Tax=Vagococcus elongatus TaxID=180344 RepID=UPI00319E7A94